MPILRPLITCCLLLLCSGFLSPVFAQSGSSLPYFGTATVHIPRIDVEGYGSLQLALVLNDEETMTFVIAEALPASTALTPGATFDLGSQILDIPLLKADSEFYSVKLQLSGTDLFQLLTADSTTLPGQDYYNTLCASCHGADGKGGLVNVPLLNCTQCGSHDVLGSYINNVMPLGAPSSCVDTCASDIADFILTVFTANTSPLVSQAIEAIKVMPLDETLRKAALQLVGRLPTDSELATVASGDEAGLQQVLDQMMLEQAFYDRLSEIFNDLVLTNRYLAANGPAEQALNLMRRFPTARWFDPGVGQRPENFQELRVTTNDSVALEPLQLINYVVRNELPMTEIVTADYFVVNGYSAKSYGVIDQLPFQDEWDANEWLPATLPGIPHAGLLTSLMFLNRYPTSATNRNRGRSRVVYDLFLDVDILALDGVRPDGSAVDITSPAPTLDNPDCVVCHGLLDPVASSFQNWNQRGVYRPNAPWYEDMFQAGFGGVDRPAAAQKTSLQWLAGELASDSRFDDGIVRILYFGLTGQEPLDPPGQLATAAQVEAWQAESTLLATLRDEYVADGQNLKTLVKQIVLSPYWRADGLHNAGFAVVHAETGAARLLTPELLHRKINAVLGFEWRGPLDTYSLARDIDRTARLLDNRQFYHGIYGGIDSFAITERLTEPNGLMVFVQERMANELACYAVPNDFLNAASNRILFPYVDADMQPIGSANQTAIRSNIQYLHARLLGEELPPDAAEIDATYALFTSVLSTGQAAIGSGESAALPPLCQRHRDLDSGALLAQESSNDPDYVLRAWMAVTAYLLSDYSFLYE